MNCIDDLAVDKERRFDIEGGGWVQFRAVSPATFKSIHKKTVKQGIDYKKIEGTPSRIEYDKVDVHGAEACAFFVTANGPDVTSEPRFVQEDSPYEKCNQHHHYAYGNTPGEPVPTQHSVRIRERCDGLSFGENIAETP